MSAVCGALHAAVPAPPPGRGLACRTCWGLTYESRATRTYRDSPHGRGALAKIFGVTQRDAAYMQTYHVRQQRYTACEQRWERRRLFLTPAEWPPP